jgi:hypothetical protein
MPVLSHFKVDINMELTLIPPFILQIMYLNSIDGFWVKNIFCGCFFDQNLDAIHFSFSHFLYLHIE